MIWETEFRARLRIWSDKGIIMCLSLYWFGWFRGVLNDVFYDCYASGAMDRGLRICSCASPGSTTFVRGIYNLIMGRV